MIESMELQVLHISDAELIKDARAILQRVETGAEIIIERDARIRLSDLLIGVTALELGYRIAPTNCRC